MIKRRAFLAGTLSAVSVGSCKAQSATAVRQNPAMQTPLEPLVWPVVTKLQPRRPFNPLAQPLSRSSIVSNSTSRPSRMSKPSWSA
jgi:hypothetical protein